MALVLTVFPAKPREAQAAVPFILADSDAASGGAASGSAAEPAQTAVPDDDEPDIGEEAFDDDSHLKYEVTDEIGSRVGVIITGYDTEYYEKFDSVTIPETIDGYPVLSIGVYAFEDSRFKNITLPSGLKLIGSAAFIRCSKLKSIEIPAGVTEIGDDAFNNCIKLKSVTFKGNNIDSIEYSTFSGKSIQMLFIIAPSSVR